MRCIYCTGGGGGELPKGDAPIPRSTASVRRAKRTGQVSAARSSFSPGEAVGTQPFIIHHRAFLLYRHQGFFPRQTPLATGALICWEVKAGGEEGSFAAFAFVLLKKIPRLVHTCTAHLLLSHEGTCRGPGITQNALRAIVLLFLSTH